MPRYANAWEEMAHAVAAGKRVSDWSKDSGTPLSTCYTWSSTAEFKARVAAIRAELHDAFIGKLTGAAETLANGLLDLATGAQSETVKLGAIRGAIEDLLKVSAYRDQRTLQDAILPRLVSLEKQEQTSGDAE